MARSQISNLIKMPYFAGVVVVNVDVKTEFGWG